MMRLFVLLTVLLTAAGGAFAQSYPDKPVRIIVPFIAGSAPDVMARQAATRLTSGLGQQVIVENKPGVAGSLGAEVAARAAPDGYTLMLLTSSHVLNKFLYARVNYDVLKDFAPITLVTRIPSLMVVPPASPVARPAVSQTSVPSAATMCGTSFLSTRPPSLLPFSAIGALAPHRERFPEGQLVAVHRPTGQIAGAHFALRDGESIQGFVDRLSPLFFDPSFEPFVTNKTPQEGRDLLLASANNLYVNVTMKDLDGFVAAAGFDGAGNGLAARGAALATSRKES